MIAVIAWLWSGGCMAQGASLLDLSRSSGVMLESKSGNSKGSGALIGDQHVLTCFHVVAALSAQGATVNWSIYPDLQVVLPSGERISGAVVSVPTEADPAPLAQDFAIVKLASQRKPSQRFHWPRKKMS
jgi:hypothetical protein